MSGEAAGVRAGALGYQARERDAGGPGTLALQGQGHRLWLGHSALREQRHLIPAEPVLQVRVPVAMAILVNVVFCCMWEPSPAGQGAGGSWVASPKGSMRWCMAGVQCWTEQCWASQCWSGPVAAIEGERDLPGR